MAVKLGRSGNSGEGVATAAASGGSGFEGNWTGVRAIYRGGGHLEEGRGEAESESDGSGGWDSSRVGRARGGAGSAQFGGEGFLKHFSRETKTR